MVLTSLACDQSGLPTIVAGIAGLTLPIGRPCVDCDRPLVPLDGVNNWGMFSEAGGKSARTEVLLDLQAMAGWGDPALTKVRGSGALRVGKWKLLHGHTAVWKKPNNMASECTARCGTTCTTAPSKCTYNISAEDSP